MTLHGLSDHAKVRDYPYNVNTKPILFFYQLSQTPNQNDTMIYSIQLFSEKRTNRHDAFSAERVLVSTVKCGELRANGRPIDYALLKTGNFRANVNFAKVFVLENNGKSSKWRQIEAKMV